MLCVASYKQSWLLQKTDSALRGRGRRRKLTSLQGSIKKLQNAFLDENQRPKATADSDFSRRLAAATMDQDANQMVAMKQVISHLTAIQENQHDMEATALHLKGFVARMNDFMHGEAVTGQHQPRAVSTGNDVKLSEADVQESVTGLVKAFQMGDMTTFAAQTTGLMNELGPIVDRLHRGLQNQPTEDLVSRLRVSIRTGEEVPSFATSAYMAIQLLQRVMENQESAEVSANQIRITALATIGIVTVATALWLIWINSYDDDDDD